MRLESVWRASSERSLKYYSKRETEYHFEAMLNTSQTQAGWDRAHAHPLVDELFVLGSQLVKRSPVDAHRRCRSLREARQAK